MSSNCKVEFEEGYTIGFEDGVYSLGQQLIEVKDMLKQVLDRLDCQAEHEIPLSDVLRAAQVIEQPETYVIDVGSRTLRKRNAQTQSLANGQAGG